MTSITFYKSDLAPVAERAAMIANPSSPFEIVQCVRVSATDGVATVAACNPEILSSETLPCEGDAFDIVVDGASLSKFAKGAPKDEITLKVDELRVTCSSGRSRLQLGSHNPTQFPTLPMPEGESSEVSSDALLTAFGRVRYAIGRDKGRPQLEGVAFRLSDGTVSAIATTGAILSSMPIEGWTSDIDLMIPAASIPVLEKSIPSGLVNIRFDGAAALFTYQGGSIRATLLDYQFPDIARLMPHDKASCEAIIDSKALASAVARLSLAGDDSGIRFERDGDGFALSVNSTYRGREASDFIAAEIEGEIEPFGFTAKNLVPTLASFDGAVTVECRGPRVPFVFKSAAQPDRVALVYPYKV